MLFTKKTVYILLGVFLSLCVYAFGPYLYLQSSYLLTKPASVTSTGSISETTRNLARNYLAGRQFAIYIPKIEARTKIIPEVDPFNEAVYNLALTEGIAHAKGSALPGSAGNTFLFSHSSVNIYDYTRYDKSFYLLNKLEQGERFYIANNGDIFEYQVSDIKVVGEDEVSYITGSGNHEKHTATLMTCWPLGTSFRRLIVIGELTGTI